MKETVNLEIDVPNEVIESMTFKVTCGLTERWVKHRDVCSRTDGPWIYFTSSSGTTLGFSDLDAALHEAMMCARQEERRRLLGLAVRRAAVALPEETPQ